MQDYDPSIGVDTTSPDGRSYEAPWQAFANDYMIRAVVVPQEAGFAMRCRELIRPMR